MTDRVKRELLDYGMQFRNRIAPRLKERMLKNTDIDHQKHLAEISRVHHDVCEICEALQATYTAALERVSENWRQYPDVKMGDKYYYGW